MRFFHKPIDPATAAEPSLIRRECPQCLVTIEMPEAMIGVQATCPKCVCRFLVTEKESSLSHSDGIPLAGPSAEETARRAKLAVEREKQVRVERIRWMADVFTTVAIIFMAAGVIGFFWFLLKDDLPMGQRLYFLMGAGVFCAGSIWLYLVAQVIHIRANTER